MTEIMNLEPCERNYRRSRFQIFFKIEILKIFANFTGKHLCRSLVLITLQVWSCATLLTLLIFKHSFFNEHLRWPCFSYRVITYLNRKSRLECELQEKKTKHIHASAADLLHFRIGNLDWCKCGLCKNKAREIDCLCCREVNAMLMILWVTARLLITSVCLV